jgi:predicted nicotinamide N-methyase
VWAYLWPAAQVLAELVSTDLAPRVRGRAVIELGCGLGAVGLAAARAGAEVTLTDGDREALALAESNARENDLTVRTLPLEWARVPDALAGAFDVVLGSDVSYSPDSTVELVGAIDTLLAADGEAWLSHPARVYGSVLVAAANRAKLTVEHVHTIAEGPRLPTSDDSDDRPIHVYCVRRNLSVPSRV